MRRKENKFEKASYAAREEEKEKKKIAPWDSLEKEKLRIEVQKHRGETKLSCRTKLSW